MLGFPTTCIKSVLQVNCSHVVDPNKGYCLNRGKLIGGEKAGKGATETNG